MHCSAAQNDLALCLVWKVFITQWQDRRFDWNELPIQRPHFKNSLVCTVTIPMMKVDCILQWRQYNNTWWSTYDLPCVMLVNTRTSLNLTEQHNHSEQILSSMLHQTNSIATYIIYIYMLVLYTHTLYPSIQKSLEYCSYWGELVDHLFICRHFFSARNSSKQSSLCRSAFDNTHWLYALACTFKDACTNQIHPKVE